MQQQPTDFQSMCCPDPSTAVIEEDEEVRPLRENLHYFYYSEYGYVVCLAITQGPVKAIFGLFNVWICYMCYASLHFC